MLRDRVGQQTTTNGTGPYELTGQLLEHRTLQNAGYANGDPVLYYVKLGTLWEANEGTLTIPGIGNPTLSRDRLIKSSTGAVINWPDNAVKSLIVDVPAEMFGPLGGRLVTAAHHGSSAVNAIVLTTNIETPVFKDGLVVEFEVQGAPTAAVTAKLNALAAKPVLHKSGDQAGVGSWEGTARLRLAADQSLDAWILMAGHRPGSNKGADIASAATLAKPADARDGSYHRITGDVTIANLWAGAPAGIEHEFEVVAGFTVTNGANLIVPGGDYAFAAGDRFKVRHIGGNVWFLRQVMLATGKPFRKSNGTRTVAGAADNITKADDGFRIEYTNAAGCTITMASLATLGPDFTCTISAAQVTADLVVNAAGGDAFEGGGGTVRVQPFNNGGRNFLRIDTRSAGLIYTSERRFRSAGQTITAAAQRQVAHGLGAKPRKWWLKLRCLTAELGFSVGDEIIYPQNYTLNSGAANGKGAVLRADSTNLTLRFGATATGLFSAPRPDTGAGVALTDGNWEAILEGEF